MSGLKARPGTEAFLLWVRELHKTHSVRLIGPLGDATERVEAFRARCKETGETVRMVYLTPLERVVAEAILLDIETVPHEYRP